jgi:type IV pilus assembly protein PilA
MTMKIERGITITELLIAIVILAILAAVVMARFQGKTERAATAEAIGMLSAIRQAEAAWRLENATYAAEADKGNLDVDISSATKFTYTILSADANGFSVEAKRNDDSTTTQECKDKTITINEAGLFGGSHPYGPKPDANSTC